MCSGRMLRLFLGGLAATANAGYAVHESRLMREEAQSKDASPWWGDNQGPPDTVTDDAQKTSDLLSTGVSLKTKSKATATHGRKAPGHKTEGVHFAVHGDDHYTSKPRPGPKHVHSGHPGLSLAEESPSEGLVMATDAVIDPSVQPRDEAEEMLSEKSPMMAAFGSKYDVHMQGASNLATGQASGGSDDDRAESADNDEGQARDSQQDKQASVPTEQDQGKLTEPEQQEIEQPKPERIQQGIRYPDGTVEDITNMANVPSDSPPPSPSALAY